MDLNRYEDFTIPNITNLNDEFKLEFWYYTQSYVGVNFNKMTITWDFHIKIVPKYNSVTDTFSVDCYPIPDFTNPANDGTPANASHGVSKDPAVWLYVVCGLKVKESVFYASNGYFPGDTKFSTPNTIPNSNTVKLTIQEQSTKSFGIVYIREMRLWNCYNCNIGLSFSPYDYSDKLFEDVVHVFHFDDPKGTVIDDENPITKSKTTVKITASEHVDFKGNNILKPTPGIVGGGSNNNPTGKPPQCYEDGHFFYDILKQFSCDSKFFN